MPDNVMKDKVTTLYIGGKERHLKFDLNAYAELEERFGSMDGAMKALSTGSMKSLRTILWAGLIHEEAVIDENTGEPIKYNITPYQVGSWVSAENLPIITNKLNESMSKSMPDINSSPEFKAAVESELNKLGLDAEGKPLPKDPKRATVVASPEDKTKNA
jgi:hypothetical protein